MSPQNQLPAEPSLKMSLDGSGTHKPVVVDPIEKLFQIEVYDEAISLTHNFGPVLRLDALNVLVGSQN